MAERDRSRSPRRVARAPTVIFQKVQIPRVLTDAIISFCSSDGSFSRDAEPESSRRHPQQHGGFEKSSESRCGRSATQTGPRHRIPRRVALGHAIKRFGIIRF